MCEYNTPPNYLKEAVLSILGQTYQNFELIIVNDKSSTFSANELYLLDDRIRIVNNPTNLGLAASRNIGIEKSSGKYIAIMDTDDICFKNSKQ